MLLTDATVSGTARYPALVLWMLVLFAPTTFLMVRGSLVQQRKSDDIVSALTRQATEAARIANHGAAQREVQAKRQEFESRLANAMDMAEDEAEVIDVIERSMAATLPAAAAELCWPTTAMPTCCAWQALPPTGDAPGCGVSSPDHCPAARRSQVQHFTNSDALDACPKLRGRPQGTVSAVCVPVSIMGRTVGVLHAVGEADEPFAPSQVTELGTLANQAGARIGLLRVMADTQLQAATDSLTGLLNRRSFERKLTALRASEPTVALAMADLDHFKTLNDTYGHDTGDRALRLFADVLRGCFREHDLLCRQGGEEFLIALPACTAEAARRALEGVRERLDAALTVAGLPQFTVSIGVIDSTRAGRTARPRFPRRRGHVRRETRRPQPGRRARRGGRNHRSRRVFGGNGLEPGRDPGLIAPQPRMREVPVQNSSRNGFLRSLPSSPRGSESRNSKRAGTL